MILSPMRFKSFVWPHNPETYQISFRRQVTALKIPFGRGALQDLGLCHRVLSGTGSFFGKRAYDTFKELACLMYDDAPGTLVHPVWMSARARLVTLSLLQEPEEDFVRYSFEFWEEPPAAAPASVVAAPAAEAVAAAAAPMAAKTTVYVVVKGDTLWGIARRFGMTLAAVIALNPQIKNPNLIYPGDKVTVSA